VREDTVVVARDGAAWAYVRVPAIPRGTREAVAFEVTAPGVPAASTRLSTSAEDGFRSPWTGFVRDASGGPALAGALGTTEPERRVSWLSRDGFAVLPRDSTGSVRVPSLPGFRWRAIEREANEVDAVITPAGGAVVESNDPWNGPLAWIPIAGGALHGRRILVDPDGGGGDAAGVGANGTRASLLNLRVARILRGFLEASGAEVRLTRDGDYALSEVERVQISEAFAAERYLRIGHRAEAPRLGHFFSSAPSRAWAERTARTLERFGLARPAVGEDPQYPLQQTSCPAVYAGLARIDRPESEEALLAPGALHAEAYALYVAIAREFSPDADWAVDSLEVRDPGGRPVPRVPTRIGSLLLETDGLGRVRFARTEPGALETVAGDSRVAARAILLDSTRGAVLSGQPGR
jgi:N-acetylmuramoyl-L-alanine amidase